MPLAKTDTVYPAEEALVKLFLSKRSGRATSAATCGMSRTPMF